MNLRGTGQEGDEWMYLAQDRDKWWALNTVMKEKKNSKFTSENHKGRNQGVR
jgi:hypothetical protein